MLKVNSISFAYTKKPILEDVSFSLQPGEHVSVIGASGSGKTTLLKLIYGEYDLDKGKIHWKDTEVLGPKFNLVVGYDFIKYVSQEFDLMPYTTVEENIGKHLSNFYPDEKKKRVAELLEVVELLEFAKTKVKLLSGGQKQRVALARAIAKQPELILLDEPFSHIDNFKKQSLRRSLFSYLKQHNIACLVATHDKNDVLPYSDKIIVLDQGEIAANDFTKAIYKHPKTPLIASFFGEFNQFKISDITDLNDGSTIIVYANEVKLIEQSSHKFVVTHSYFQGANYLVAGQFKNQTIFAESPISLKINSNAYFEIDSALIKQRRQN